jgi:hypothetical protein
MTAAGTMVPHHKQGESITSFERAVEHRGRTVPAVDCALAGAERHGARPLNCVVGRQAVDFRVERNDGVEARTIASLLTGGIFSNLTQGENK